MSRLNCSGVGIDAQLAGSFGVFLFGLDENWNAGIGILPDREEILIRLSGFWQIADQSVGAAEA